MYNLSYPYAIIFVQKYENERTKKQKCKNAKKENNRKHKDL